MLELQDKNDIRVYVPYVYVSSEPIKTYCRIRLDLSSKNSGSVMLEFSVRKKLLKKFKGIKVVQMIKVSDCPDGEFIVARTHSTPSHHYIVAPSDIVYTETLYDILKRADEHGIPFSERDW